MLTLENAFTEYPNIVTVQQLQEMLNISRSTAYGIVKSGKIKTIRIGNAYKIPKIYIIDFLNRQNISA